MEPTDELDAPNRRLPESRVRRFEAWSDHAFQACSIDHSDISPFRINHLRAAWNSVAQNPPSNPGRPRSTCQSGICRRISTGSSTELCQTFKCAAITCGDPVTPEGRRTGQVIPVRQWRSDAASVTGPMSSTRQIFSRRQTATSRCTPGTIARSASRIVLAECADLRRIAHTKRAAGNVRPADERRRSGIRAAQCADRDVEGQTRVLRVASRRAANQRSCVRRA